MKHCIPSIVASSTHCKQNRLGAKVCADVLLTETPLGCNGFVNQSRSLTFRLSGYNSHPNVCFAGEVSVNFKFPTRWKMLLVS